MHKQAIWLVLGVLCVLLKPAVGLAGALHRDLHAASHAAQASPSTVASSTIDGDSEEHEPTSGWHAVMHVDLCCANAALSATASLAPFPGGASHRIELHAAGVLSSPRMDVFRPPIAG
ncbi:MAG: hypothetical protein ABI650_03075 [Dokdonella sp.]